MIVTHRLGTEVTLTVFSIALALGGASAAAAQTDSPPPKTDPAKAADADADKPPKQTAQPTQELQGPPAPEAPAPQRRETLGQAVPEPTVQLKPGEVPEARFDTPVYDFGRVKAGTQVKHDFWFTNGGSGPLEILAVRPSCGCTTSGDFDRIVQPGESGKIPIQVNTEKFNGPLTKSVTVSTNARSPNDTVNLQIKGVVWQVLDVMPRAANFGKLLEFAERKLVITNNSDEAAELTDIRSDNPMFKPELRVIEPGKKFELIITADPAGRNQATGKITLSTGLSDMPTLEVFANAYIPPVVELQPRRVTVTPAAPGVQLKRRVFVRNNEPEKPLEITDLAVSNPDIKLSIEAQDPGTRFQIILEFPSGYRAPPSGDFLTFRTNVASMPTARIPILQVGGAIAGRPARPANKRPATTLGKPNPTGANR